MTPIRAVWRAEPLQTPALAQIAQWLERVSASRYAVWLLVGLGLARGLLALLAYPPAHGADSMAYFFYAERLAGLDIPGISQSAPGLYPLVLLVGYKWLGSAYLVIGLQLLMSIAIAPMYFLALKRFNPILALLISLVIVFDFQTAVVFNFISTEPLYIFLLALSFYVFLRQAESPIFRISDALPGVLVLLLMLTRAVARFVIAPLAIIFWWRTRSLKRTLMLVGGFLGCLLIYSLLSQAFLGQVESLGSSNYMVSSIVIKNKSWLAAEHGPASAAFLALQNECTGQRFYDCYAQKYGSWDGMLTLIVNTVLETVAVNWQLFVSDTWKRTNDFLSLSGQQLGFDPDLPSEVQCRTVDEEVDAMTPETVLRRSTWAWSIRSYVEENFEEFRDKFRSMRMALCPPLAGSSGARQMVDYLMFRYRSLGRPQPYLYYGMLGLLVIALPWSRRYRMVFLSAGSVLLYHALVSAVVHNVQPRYVMVTNPFRAILLMLLVYVVVRIGITLVDSLLTKARRPDATGLKTNKGAT